MAFATNFKAPKGTALRERKQRHMDAAAEEKKNKAEARKRDKVCRWPFCDCATFKLRTEVAHVVSKSLGGSNDPRNLILFCFEKHQGRPSLHSGDLKVVPHDARKGTNGTCDFFRQDERGRWQLVAAEKYIGVSVAVGA